MRGDAFMGGFSPVVEEPVQGSTEVAAPATGNNLAENTQPAKHSIMWWLMLAVLYFIWDFVQTRNKVTEAIQPRNIRANAHNLLVIGVGAVVFLKGANVLLTKLAAMRIPVVSRIAGAFLPLFNF